MENASQALIIAGGILLAIILLSVAVVTSNSIGDMTNAQDNAQKTAELAKFNQQYEAYNKELMYGTDLMTLIKKVQDYNKKYDYTIDLFLDNVKLINDDETINDSGIKNNDETIYKKDENGNYIETEDGEYIFDYLLRQVYKCTAVGYDNETGKIKSMEFKTINIDEYR